MSASSSDGTIRSVTAGPTGPPPSCVPKSPWIAFVSQIWNWTGSGLSSPRRSRSASTSCCRASNVRSSLLPTRISAASPGRAEAIAYVIIEIATRTASSEMIGVRKRISRRRRGT